MLDTTVHLVILEARSYRHIQSLLTVLEGVDDALVILLLHDHGFVESQAAIWQVSSWIL